MKTKTFCILEQGDSINEDITIHKKRLFTTEFSDFYRLNWKNNGDPNAYITQTGIVWSEGRSLLYEKVPKNYDYYILTDDDIEFFSDCTDNIPHKIQELLNEYNPISATFFDPNRWEQDPWNFPNNISKEIYLSRKAFPIATYDLQVQICSKSFADVIFPVWYHGAERSMWYSQWACYRLFPYKQMCFPEIQVRNIRRGQRYNEAKLQYSSGQKLVWLFNRDVKDDFLVWGDNNSRNQDNILIFKGEVDKTKILFALNDFEKIYDINKPVFKGRTPITNQEYILRNFRTNILWSLENPGVWKTWLLGFFSRMYKSIKRRIIVKN